MSDLRARARRSLAIAVLGSLGFAAPATAATIGLSGVAFDPVVIVGATTTLQATVTNTGAAADGDLNYAITFNVPGGPVTSNDTLAPGDNDSWQVNYDSTGQPFGENLIGVSVQDPNATNSPQGTEISVTVLDHSEAYLSREFGPLMQLAQEPTVDFLAFGATGGGETFSAIAMSIVNDPLVPTAGLDLDAVYDIGDAQITSDLSTFVNLPFNDDPHAGHQFNVYVDITQLGTFTKTFYLAFSDQDLPGATAPYSELGQFTVVAHVVPEPASVGLVASGLVALAATRRKRAR